MTKSLPPTDLTIYYDFASPFCYVAQEIAARLIGRFLLRVAWRPFEVIDYLPDRGALPQNPAFVRRAEAASAARLAREYDLDLHLPERLLNSNLALCAVEYAADLAPVVLPDESVADRLRRSLFEACYRDRRDISDAEVVLDVAAACGVTDNLEDALRNRRYVPRVAESRAAAHAMGVVAVPTWLAAGYGAVGVPEFSELMRLVEAARSVESS